MAEKQNKERTAVTLALAFLAVISQILYAAAAVGLAISLSSSVLWNVYEDYFNNNDTRIYFSHTLQDYQDQGMIDGIEICEHCGYIAVIDVPKANDFKESVLNKLYIAIGTMGGAALCIVILILASSVTKRKLLIAVLAVLAIVLGIVGGYFSLVAMDSYKDGIPSSVNMIRIQQFLPEKNKMKFGHDLALYCGISSIVASVLVLVYLFIYLCCGKGIWACSTKKLVDAAVDKIE